MDNKKVYYLLNIYYLDFLAKTIKKIDSKL